MFQKILVGLVSMQTVMLVLLFMKVDALETRESDSGEPVIQVKENPFVAAEPGQGEVVAANAGLDSRQLRQVLREELRGLARSDELLARTSMRESETPVYDETEMQYRRELVLEELNLLKQQVDVSSGELDSLLGEIAKLDPETRTRMLKEVTLAVNRGEINGRL